MSKVFDQKKAMLQTFQGVGVGQTCWITINGNELATRKETPTTARDVADGQCRPMLPSETVMVML